MAASSQTEIDHILPFSRTLTDSMADKVVCLAGAKRDKVNQSPFEAFGHNPPGYDYAMPFGPARRRSPRTSVGASTRTRCSDSTTATTL